MMDQIEWEQVSEAEWNRLHALLESDREQLALFKNHNLELQQWIDKAKTILASRPVVDQDAYEALEGK